MKANAKIENIWDVVVIGGGPAGMIAAGRAAERGRSVLLLEKNEELGKKLLITGGGRCNLTNSALKNRAMLTKYKDSEQFLFSAFSQFGVEDTLEFFRRFGVFTKEEEEGRIFPVSNQAQSVLDALIDYMQKGDVRIQTDAVVTDIVIDADKKYVIRTRDGVEAKTKTCIIATGGTARPETGSTGEGFKWLKKIGHTIIDGSCALVPIALKDAWAKKISGVTLDDVKLTTFQNGQKQSAQIGKLLFTHTGISGPMVLNMSKEVGELLKYGEVVINIDLFPKLDHGALKKQLQTLLVAESNKQIKNTLSKLISSALVLVILELADIKGETPNHSVKSEERTKIVELIKSIPLNVLELLGADKAIASSGGVALQEVDFKTMQSRLAPNLYIIGDTLNIDRLCGGYSLQLCWTTGYVAGNSV